MAKNKGGKDPLCKTIYDSKIIFNNEIVKENFWPVLEFREIK
ncbi:hypothetical protein WAZ07_21820 [Bacillus sp. FJAT-51639]|uniref:Uncharacterized protein n=1 Tax=Bacillus bruguierae TaxID=3127667 RepID=A0ABU8FPH5_9BACI